MRPNSLSRRLVSILLAVLVLNASVGLTVQRLTCRMSGRSTVAISVASRAEMRGCTDKLTAATPGAKDDCCDFSRHGHQLSIATHEQAAKILMPVLSPAAIVP